MPDLEPGLGRTQSEQALYQLAVLGITLGLALVAGMATGMVLTLAAFDPPKDEDMFQDIYFNLPNSTNDEEGSSRAGDEDPPAAGDKVMYYFTCPITKVLIALLPVLRLLATCWRNRVFQ